MMSIRAGTIEQITSSSLHSYKVILHNDTIHSVDDVIKALVASVPVSPEEAERITMTAHQEGRAVVIECRKETAEYYKERLESYRLTITIEPA
jgi:ATP-dependent Clp protease adaptor protein ClpS